jgi:hypothetical protein
LVGILVHGDNHLILAGPLPAPACARRLAQSLGLSLVLLGAPREQGRWAIRTREYRENLSWAVQLEGGGAPSPAVAVLLDELAGRGIKIYRETDSWEGVPCV